MTPQNAAAARREGARVELAVGVEHSRRVAALHESADHQGLTLALVPLALKGVKYQALGAASLLRKNLLIYGLGGLLVPFIGIKLIDILLNLV